MAQRGLRFFSSVAAAMLLTGAISVRAEDKKPGETLWSVGEDGNGCFAATSGPGVGITYSDKERFQVFLAGGNGSATSPSPSVNITIGQVAERLPLKAIGEEGWLLHESASAQSIRAFTAEMLKGTSGPISIKSDDVGIDMSFETADLQSRGPLFWQCVKRQTPDG